MLAYWLFTLYFIATQADFVALKPKMMLKNQANCSNCRAKIGHTNKSLIY